MRNVFTLICAGFICFTGSAVHAQSSMDDMTSLIQNLASGGTDSNAVRNISEGVTQQIIAEPQTTQQRTFTIEGPLTIDTPVPDVNRTAVEIIDTRTGRYAPRMKINFADFPLKSLNQTSRADKTKTHTSIVSQRIQDRIRAHKIDLVVQDRTVVVSGTVETEQQRKLVESMLRFEPGIDVVKNEIVVNPQNESREQSAVQ